MSTVIRLEAPAADALGRDLDAAGKRLEDLAALNTRQGEQALAGATIPVDTGRLKESSYVVADVQGFALSASAPYAGIVHARNPFFTRALDGQTDPYLDALETHTGEILATITGD